MTRSGLLFAWLVIACAAGLLTAESMLPGQVLLPLLPDDLPTWREGAEPDSLIRHPAPNYTMSDVDHLLVPGLEVTRRALDRGELPWWDPSQALGVPHVGEVHYAVFYPPAWIPLAFGLRGLGPLAWFHLLMAGGGMLLYLRSLRRSATAALTGALAFALSAWITARLQSFPVVGAAVWLPWVLWGLERGARLGKARSYLAAALAMALSFAAGFPQVSLLVLAVAGWMEFARLIAWRTRGLRPALWSLAAVGLACLLAAGQLLPTWSYMRADSARAEQDAAVLAQDGLQWPLMNQLVAPDTYACAALTGPHPLALGSLTQATLPAALNRAETSMGIGVLGLILALLAMLFGRTWTTRAWTLLVLLLFALLLHPPLLEAAAHWVPVLRFGSPKRLLLITTAGLSVLAAGGAELVARERLRVTAMGWVLALAATAWAVVLMVGVPSVETPDDVDSWALSLARQFGMPDPLPQDVYSGVPLPRESFELAANAAFNSALVALAAALAAVILFRPRSTRTQQGWTSLARRAPEMLTVLLAAELVITAFPLLRAAPTEGVFEHPESLELPTPPVLLRNLAAVGQRVVPPRMARVGNDPPWLRPNLPLMFGLLDTQAYAPMVPRRSAELIEALAPGSALSGSALGGFTTGEQLQSPLVDMLGIEFVLTSDPELTAAGFEPLESAGSIRVLHNLEAYPHAWCVGAGVVSPARGDRPGAWIDDPTFDPASRVALERAPPGASLPLVALEIGQPAGSRVGDGAAESATEEASAAEPVGESAAPAAGEADGGAPEAVEPVSPAVGEADGGAPETGDAGVAEEDGPPPGVAAPAGEGAQTADTDVAESEAEGDAALTADDEPAAEEGSADLAPAPARLLPVDDEDFGARRVAMLLWQPGRVECQVGPGAAAALVLAESFHSGWKASVAGQAAPVLRADHALLAVPLPASEQDLRVELVFSSEQALRGAWWGLGGLVFALLLVIVLDRRTRHALVEPDR